MNKKKADEIYSILILGDSTVGKTCFLIRFNEDFFQEIYLTTMGYDFKLKEMTLSSGQKITAKLWDTAGQERFKSLAKNYYKAANGIVLIYDITKRESFVNVDTWMEQIREKAPSNIQVILVGNKCDIQDKRVVNTEEGEELSKKYNIPFFESSAKDNINITETFQSLVDKISLNMTEKVETNEKLQKNNKKKSKMC